MENLNQDITNEVLLFIIEQLQETVHITDNDGVVLYANHAAEVLEGIPVEEMIGKSITSLYTYSDYEEGSLPPCLLALETDEPRIDQNCEYYSRDGQKVSAIVSNYPYIIANKNNKRVVCSISDNVNIIKERLKISSGVGKKHAARLQKKLMKNGTIYIFDDIIGQSPIMINAIDIAKRFVVRKMPIMIYGETGTGKEMFAQSIHNASTSMHNNFVPLNCAAIPENLMESVLFGTVKGAFTGALNKPGLFEVAQGGTLFLDEINSMPINLQAILLRAIQEKSVRRIGGSEEIPVNCRIISATNKNPIEAVQCQELREDLFYRLSSGIVSVPPLRERGGDLSLLARHIMEKCNEDFGNNIYQISDELQDIFSHYSWPGNIRELVNTIESAMNMTAPDDVILTVKHLPSYLKNRFQQHFSSEKDAELAISEANSFPKSVTSERGGLKDSVELFEQYLIKSALKKTNGNILVAATTLNITRQGLEKKLKKYGIDVKKYRFQKKNNALKGRYFFWHIICNNNCYREHYNSVFS